MILGKRMSFRKEYYHKKSQKANKKKARILLILSIICFGLLFVNLAIGGIIIFASLITILLILAYIFNKKGKEMEEKYLDLQEDEVKTQRGLEKGSKTILFGMIKAHKSIEISKAAETLNIHPEQIKRLIYEFLGEDKIEGSFIGDDTFQIQSDINEFISVLDSKFEDWRESEQTKNGKT